MPDGPAIMIANEFLDALPVRQFVRGARAWRERMVGLNSAGKLIFDVADRARTIHQGRAANGEVLEVSAFGHRLMFEIGGRLVEAGRSGAVHRLWARRHPIWRHAAGLRAHRYVDPLVAPGDCDVTAHVDFAAMARSARAAGAAVYGPIDQGDFLRAIGIDLRAAQADARRPRRAEGIERARERLAGKGQGEMGALFKVMVVADRGLPVPPGFQPLARSPRERGPVLAAGGLRRSGLAHGFFTRRGGVSQGVYASLNGGVGSRDDPGAVRDNRARMAAALGIAAERLLCPIRCIRPTL